jgi:hypothetical protein
MSQRLFCLDLVAGGSSNLRSVGQRCRTSPRCCRAQPNRLTVFVLLIKVQVSNVLQFVQLSRTCTIMRVTIHKPTKRIKDQKRTWQKSANLAQKCMVHHAASAESCGIYIPPKRPKNLVVIILLLALCSHMATTNYNKRLNLNMFF